MTNPNNDRPVRALARAAVPAAVILFLAGAAAAHETADSVAVDGPDHTLRYANPQLSANDARRAAYSHMAELGYRRHGGPGSVRVRSTTREGDTWIVEVAYSAGGRVLSQRAMLYVDAESALVSEVPPENLDNRVAAE